MKNIIKRTALIFSAVCAVAALTATVANTSFAENQASGQDTLYSIASVSKVYVSVATMQLAERGLLDIDEPIVTYIPEFEMADQRYKEITARMLMNHSSGFMGTTNRNVFLFEDNSPEFHDNLLSLLKNQRLKASPGDFSVYCNDGFSLLELLVERISGMDFTDYLTENIIIPSGCVQTGTYRNDFQNPYQVDIFNNKKPFAHEYCISIGSGGILSTAEEVCRFGSTFFSGNETLLSEDSKMKMCEMQTDDIYEGRYGLGWDDVDLYEDKGVTVLTKNGALQNQFSSLMVAPEENISVAVLQSGGESSAPDMLAKSLLDVALAEKGIDLSEDEKKYHIVDSVPEKYAEYEGFYTDGYDLYQLCFPGMKYMQVVNTDGKNNIPECYKYTSEDGFIRIYGDITSESCFYDTESNFISFKERENGRKYVLDECLSDMPNVNSLRYKMYFMEKTEPESASKQAVEAWKKRSGKYYLMSEKYSSMMYMSNFSMNISCPDEPAGYVAIGSLHKIRDENHADSFVNIPFNNGRDMTDVVADGDRLIVNNSEIYISEKSFPEFTYDIEKISFSERGAKWFSVGESVSDSVLSFETSPNSSVYIYDNYDNVIYSTYMTGFENGVNLPKNSKIAFIGETGEKVNIIKK